MSHWLTKFLVVGALAITQFGCEPAPVVVNPDGDGDTTVVEERDTVVVPNDSTMPPPNSDADVNVDVGGEDGVKVDVTPEGADNLNTNQ
jgi:hypothetical protein